MEHTECDSCIHYRRHYTFDERRCFQVYCGHCTFSKAKRKLPEANACENYVAGVPIEKAFVSKEYLSKALLEYVLRMDLLPDILTEDDSIEQKK